MFKEYLTPKGVKRKEKNESLINKARKEILLKQYLENKVGRSRNRTPLEKPGSWTIQSA